MSAGHQQYQMVLPPHHCAHHCTDSRIEDGSPHDIIRQDKDRDIIILIIIVFIIFFFFLLKWHRHISHSIFIFIFIFIICFFPSHCQEGHFSDWFVGKRSFLAHSARMPRTSVQAHSRAIATWPRRWQFLIWHVYTHDEHPIHDKW